MMPDHRLSFRTLAASAACTIVVAANILAFPSVVLTSVSVVVAVIQGFAGTEPVIDPVAASPAAAFTPGNIVVYRVGTGTGSLGALATAVFLDEYAPTGTLVQSIPLPTATAGQNRMLTAVGSTTSEGYLTRSTNGEYLVLTGYNAAPGTPSIASASAGTINRVVARVDAGGNVDTSTALTDAISGGAVRGAASPDGNNIWISGSSSEGGIRHTTFGSTTSTAVSTATVTNLRATAIFDGQLFVSAQSDPYRLASVGTGLPTTGGQTITNLPGIPTENGSPYGFVFADLSSDVPGVDTVYIADESTVLNGGGAQKYCLVAGVWTLKGTIGLSVTRGLTGSVSGSTVVLYSTANGTSLNTATDTSGYNAAPNGTFTQIATSGTNRAFRGVAFAPVLPPAPAISITGGPLNFGDQTVNTTSSSLNLTVTNNGSADLVLGTPSFLTGTQFAFVTDPNGTVVAPGGGSTTIALTFTPTSTGVKNDTVLINSNAPGSAPAVSLSGTGLEANTPPIAVDDERSTPGNQTLFLTSANLVGNDIDPDPQALAVTAVSNPTNGTVSLDSGTVIFTPTTGFGGTAGFDYTVSDGIDTDTGHVTVTVAPPVGQFSWSTAQIDVVENSGSATLTIQRANGSAGTVDVYWGTDEIVANGENACAAGVDFVHVPSVVTFLDGETSKTVYVQLCDDDVSEPNETFGATLVTTVGGGTIVSPVQTVVSITDDEPRTLVVDQTSDTASSDQCSPDPGDCSLRGAISSSRDGDTITFDPTTFNLSSVSPEAMQTIVLGSQIDISTNITITGPDAAVLTVDGGSGLNRIFQVASNTTVSISGMTLTGGNAGGDGPFSQGGAILTNSGSNVSLSGMTITGNSAITGGGILVGGASTLTLTNSTVSGNTATDTGGGISGDAIGGSPEVHVIGSTFSGNSATNAGGGIYFNGGGGPFTVMNSSFSGNTAASGGGIWTFPSLAGTVTSSTFSGSSIHNEGGGLPLSNTIVSGSGCSGGGIVDGGFNLDSGNTCGFTASSSKINTDPLLGPLQDNGGPTHTMALLTGSPAIDQGSAFGLTTDQRGAARPTDRAGVPNADDGSDVGAYESLSPSAASASISGRVMTGTGRGISGVIITVQGMNGQSRVAYTNTLGYYQVDGLQVGESFVVTASARRYTFAAPVRFVSLGDNIGDLNFVAAR